MKNRSTSSATCFARRARRRGSTWPGSNARRRSGCDTCPRWRHGEYGELPGAVYTKGFLRNYGTFLGLDPEYLVDLYRLETRLVTRRSSAAARPPRPSAFARPGPSSLTPGAIAAAILTVGGGRVRRLPRLRVRDLRPYAGSADHRSGGGRPTYQLPTPSSARPNRTPGSPWTGHARARRGADAQGAFSVKVSWSPARTSSPSSPPTR